MVRYACLAANGEPESLFEALNREKWKGAKGEEYQALMKDRMWHLV
jgi:hypothetical protein